ncbi:J domain-containing protein [Spirulina sp. CS-785/01]|uniref:J domain-containing protein n=1 Tax=Spirulina sp. CS-785/01 TaxID=3021716 RepID=UPI00232C9B5C|nr:J domain-containing protein [Spirulina sp. CS-785/01]MDB9313040.1 J domain-containing protein [Spirulina sp. CS-785/01]
MNLVDCYQILGLPVGAELGQVKASYRQLARQYHPDVNPQKGGPGEAKFIEITEAYQVLLRALSPSGASVSPLPLTVQEQGLKRQTYEQLQGLLKARRFARAIALVEGLAIRLPQDAEVRQWQAIAYHCWGRHLLTQRQWQKARLYLHKAKRIDPYNRSLVAEVEKALNQLER